MSMTRKEAVAEINSALSCALMGAMLPNKQYLKSLQALSILAPELRTEPLTVGFTDHNFGETKEGMPVHTAIMHVGNYEVKVAYEPMTEILKHLGIKWEDV